MARLAAQARLTKPARSEDRSASEAAPAPPGPGGTPASAPGAPGSSADRAPGAAEEDTASRRSDAPATGAAVPPRRPAVGAPTTTAEPDPRAEREHADTTATGRRTRMALSALAALTLLALAGAIWAGVVWGLGTAADHDRTAALAAGRQAAVNLVSINYNTVDVDIQRVKDSSTGDFSSLFGQNVDSYSEIVRQGKVISTGAVAEAGVETLDGDHATVIAAVSSKVQNSQNPQGETRNYRMSMDMQQVDGTWKVAKMEFIP